MEIHFNLNSRSKNPLEELKDFVDKENTLLELDIHEITEAYNAVSLYWVSKDNRVKDLIKREGIGFLIPLL